MNIKNRIINFFSPLSLGEGSGVRLKGSGVRSLFAILLTLLAACTENKDLQVREAPQPPATGQVTITPQWATTADATALRYCFYPTEETSGEAICADGTTDGFEGELPAGTYYMVAYNANADGVRFVDTDRWQTAAVELTAVATRSNYSLVNQMPQVFAIVPQDVLTVTSGQRTTGTPDVRKLTKTLIFVFTTNDHIAVGHLTGTLCGVYPTLLLAADEPTQNATEAATSTAVRFSVDGWIAGEKKVQVSLPGLLDPQNGTRYDNRLALEVSTADGEQWNTTVDLNGTITKILEENEGTLPIDIPIEMNIEIGRTSVGISATVRGWGDSGNGDTEL